MILSFLFLFLDTKETNNWGAGDLVTALPTLLYGEGKVHDEIHNLVTDIYNDLTNGTLPEFALMIPYFYSKPTKINTKTFFKKVAEWKTSYMEDFKNLLHPGSLRNYHLLWYKYIQGEKKVLFFCQIFKKQYCKDYTEFRVFPIHGADMNIINAIRQNGTKGIILEGEINGPPCEDDNLIKTFSLKNVCTFNKNISMKPLPLLLMLKYNVQSPVYLENDHEYNFLFATKNHSLNKFGYSSEDVKPVKERPNAFVPLCSFGHDLEDQRFEDCGLFFRSFTNMGMGYTANSELAHVMFKSKHFGSPGNFFSPNDQIRPQKMTYAGSDYAFRVFIENNREEVEDFEETVKINDKGEIIDKGQISQKPKERKVSLHNPFEPANMRLNSFSIPLGHSTIIYIKPKVREIDDSAATLPESKRGCRLSKDASGLDIFKIYSKEGCLLECQIKQAYKKCGCFPWNYPIIEVCFNSF